MATTRAPRHSAVVADDPRRSRQDFTPRGGTGPCAFCDVVAGRSPAHEVLRTEQVVAFLDRHPLFLGHVLLVPVEHVQTHDELAPGLAGPWLDASQRLQRAVEAATGSEGALLIVNNVVSQSVPHVHQHVIPARVATACGSGSDRGSATATRPTRRRWRPGSATRSTTRPTRDDLRPVAR